MWTGAKCGDRQETAKLEAEAYELDQKTALAAEAKAVLDSWVRYEGQVKQRQQKELAESIIAKVIKELENPKVLQQVLQQSVADVESKSRILRPEPTYILISSPYRNCLVQSPIDQINPLEQPKKNGLSFVHPSVCLKHACVLTNRRRSRYCHHK